MDGGRGSGGLTPKMDEEAPIGARERLVEDGKGPKPAFSSLFVDVREMKRCDTIREKESQSAAAADIA